MITKFTFKPGTISINKIYADFYVNYWEDCEIDGETFDEDSNEEMIKDLLTRWDEEHKIGLVKWDRMVLIIDPETGKVENYTGHKEIQMHFKVCDECSWKIVDENNNTVLEQNDDYVPSFLSIDDCGYGDYVEITIQADGFIKGWDPEWFARWVAEASAGINGSDD